MRAENRSLNASKKTERLTRDCSTDFACLNSKSKPVCKIEHCVDGEVHFIACNGKQHCRYARHFGFSFFCSCPTRKELFNDCGI